MADRLLIPQLSLEVKASLLSPRSRLVSTLVPEAENAPAVLTLPSWVSKSLFDLYLDDTATVLKLETPAALDLLRLSSAMQDVHLEEALLRSPALTSLSPENAISAYAVAAENKERSSDWQQFFEHCLAYARANINILLEKCNVHQLPRDSLELLLMESLKTDFGRQVSDTSPVVRALKDVWNCSSVPEMLEKAEARSEASPPSQTVLQWQFALSTSMLTSPEFEVEGLMWEVRLWYREKEDRLDCYLANAVGERQNAPGALIAVSSVLCIFPEECIKYSRLVTLLLGSKGQKLIRSIFGVRARLPSETVTLKLNMRVEHAYASLLSYAAAHFEDPLVCEKANRLPGERILQLLCMKQLSVSSEDSVLRLIGQWSEKHRETANIDLQLESLLEAVHWGSLSTRGIVDCSRLYPTLKTHPKFRDAVTREFEYRSLVRERRIGGIQPRQGHSGKLYYDTNFSVFLSDLCAVLVSVDYTSDARKANADLALELSAVLKHKEREAKLLRSSLSVFRSLSTNPTPAMSLVNTLDAKKLENELPASRTHSDDLSTAAGKPNKPLSPLDYSGEVVDTKVTNLLMNLWTKVEEKTKQVEQA